MAATDDLPRGRRWLLVVPVAVLAVVAGLVLLVPGDAAGQAPPLPPPPSTSRHDATLTVDVRRASGWVTVDLVLAMDDDAADALRVVDWAGDADGFSSRLWDGSTGPIWSPALRAERLPAGQVLLHVGRGRPVDPEGTDRYEPREPHVRGVEPGQEVTARLRFEPDRTPPSEDEPWAPAGGEDLARASEVRVCVWAADPGPDDPPARPAVCADDPL